MLSVVSFVGRSNSGKTTIIERIIPLLKAKGYSVAIIKHDAHKFDIDHEGKDTWRMTKAGADTVVISSKDKLAMIKTLEQEIPLNEVIQNLIKDADIVITEGYKSLDMPKIEVVRFGELITLPENNLIAVVDNTSFGTPFASKPNIGEIPMFNFSELDKIVELIQRASI